MDEEKSVTKNKIGIALILFVGLGFLINTFLSSNQSTVTQNTLEFRAQEHEEILQSNNKQDEKFKILIDKITNLETKLENLEKTGKSIK